MHFKKLPSALLLALLLLLAPRPAARAEAMLQLFNVNWDELIQKMPEIAEAGYTSLWLPPPAKAGSVFSVGYDLFDPFDLGNLDQRGTVRTRYGTKAELKQVVALAHRFGLRVYFDNIMNHRGFDTPGYTLSTPTNLYPGLTVGDFHLRRQTDGTYRNWDSISDADYAGDVFAIQHKPLGGLLDLATENGSVNENFGLTYGSTISKPSFIRQPGSSSYYMDTNLPAIAGPWRPFSGGGGDPVPEDVNAYLIRATIWTMAETRCDGFRFDAVKHVNDTFFGDTSATTAGYVGAIQTMYDYVHGYGNNVTGNGYVEADNNRNSCFDTEATRNDALLFGEHLGEPPGFTGYIDRGMRLLGSPLHYHLNNTFGVGSLAGLEQRDPSATPFSPINSVLFAQSHDDGVANRRELHNAYNFFHEGVPSIYSDGYNQSGAPDYFPRVANAPYLGQFGDNKMPDVAYLHHQLARGGTRPRWGDADICAFERYDYREGGSAADQTVVLFAMNDNYSTQGDTAFLDGEGETFPSGINKPPGAAGDAQGIAVSFPPGTVLQQLATSTPGYDRTWKQATVRAATNVRATAATSGGSIVYVGGQSIPAGGGAIEILVPGGGYVAYGMQWPEASRASLKDAITFRQDGVDAKRMTVWRKDGVNGDSGFNPLYPFKMRGSIHPDGSVAGGVNVTNKTYAIDVPIVTNGLFDILVRSDASTVNTLLKLDGGVDLNSHLNLGSTNADKRDNRPGAATDVYLGYEQTAFLYRNGPEKFAARNVARNNVTSAGSETYYYTVGGTNLVVNGSGNGEFIDTSTADWVYHDPEATNTASGLGTATQRMPLSPGAGQNVDLHVKVGYQFHINKCVVYYTTDGTNPEGSFGVGTGTTKVVTAGFLAADAAESNIDWWKATIPGTDNQNGAQIRYKIALYKSGSSEISDGDGSKRFGLTGAGITNFNPTTATVWLHANRNTNDTVTGLQEGFHIMRARCFLPRTNKASVFNTFAQTFYYDAVPPQGEVVFPATNGATITGSTYVVVVRADNSVTGVEFNLLDSSIYNDDVTTGTTNGNGLDTNSAPIFASATEVTPEGSLNAQFPNLPREYRFTYSGVPSSGSATITVRLKELTSSILTNRVTMLARTVNTLAPANVVNISTPAVDNTVAVLETNDVFQVQTCFTSTLTTNDPNTFKLFINGVSQPLISNNFRPTGCGAGMRRLYYDYAGWLAGTNVIHVIYTNLTTSLTLNDTRTLIVLRPNNDSDGDGMSDAAEVIAGTNPHDTNSVLRITALENGNQQVVWDSVAGIKYQVLATTNMALPLGAVSPLLQASGSNTFYFDSSPGTDQKYYRIQVVP